MRWLCALFFAVGISSNTLAALTLGIHAEEPAPTIAGFLSQRLPARLSAEIQVFQDAEALQDALAKGDLDLAFIEEPVQAIPGAGIVGALYPSVLHILVPAESKADSLAAVLGAPNIWAGTSGAIGHSLAATLAGDYGIVAPDLLPDPWSNEPGAYFIFGGLLTPDALGRLDGFQLYSLDDTIRRGRGSVADGIVLRHPNLRTFILPAELYPALSTEPALTLSVNTLLLARSGLPEEDVYELAIALDRLHPEIAGLYPLAGLEELALSNTDVRAMPLHPGAQRYADREQPGLIERYAEFVGAIVTAAIGLITLGVALYRRRRQARKDRLDTYYQKALLWRDALAAGDRSSGEIMDALRGLQGEVFDLLIAERIDADAALLAFMNLSNQLLREAETSGGDKSRQHRRAELENSGNH